MSEDDRILSEIDRAYRGERSDEFTAEENKGITRLLAMGFLREQAFNQISAMQTQTEYRLKPGEFLFTPAGDERVKKLHGQNPAMPEILRRDTDGMSKEELQAYKRDIRKDQHKNEPTGETLKNYDRKIEEIDGLIEDHEREEGKQERERDRKSQKLRFILTFIGGVIIGGIIVPIVLQLLSND